MCAPQKLLVPLLVKKRFNLTFVIHETLLHITTHICTSIFIATKPSLSTSPAECISQHQLCFLLANIVGSVCTKPRRVIQAVDSVTSDGKKTTWLNNRLSHIKLLLMNNLVFVQVNINPEYTVGELDYNNNAATCNLRYTGNDVTVSNCLLGRGWDGWRGNGWTYSNNV